MKTQMSAIKACCEEEGECWIWQASTTTRGYPKIKRDGKCLSVRRVVLALDGRPPLPRQPVITTCGELLCVNPAHQHPTTPQKVGKLAAERGAFSSLARRSAIARGKQASAAAKLDMDKARAIRASDEPAPKLARQYGVSKGLITRVRRGQAWKEYSSPWAGLMR